MAETEKRIEDERKQLQAKKAFIDSENQFDRDRAANEKNTASNQVNEALQTNRTRRQY
jgi:hypothetical protein